MRLERMMMFREVEADENFDLRRFRSEPGGRWEAGILKMLWGKARVRMSVSGAGACVLDYWGGDYKTANLLLGFVFGICASLPEGISEEELEEIFPVQEDKELGAFFWDRLFKSGARARELYGDFQ